MRSHFGSSLHRALLQVLILAWLFEAASVWGQDLEPRRWTHFPADTNALSAGYAGQDLNVYFDPIIGITDGSASLNAWLARHTHAFDWSGRTARIDVMLPYVSGTWRGLVGGEPGVRVIRAGGDPWIRMSLNLLGAPALRGEGFAIFQQSHPVRTTLGASLAVSLPLGDYDSEELINVGRNRYTVRPQLGMLHIRGPWSFELTGSIFLFSANREFFGSIKLSQKPVYALQANVTRNFSDRLWLGAGIAYAAGGKVELDNTPTAFRVDNLLWNAVVSYRLTTRQSVQLAWQRGRTQVEAGSDSDSWLVSWVFSWTRP